MPLVNKERDKGKRKQSSPKASQSIVMNLVFISEKNIFPILTTHSTQLCRQNNDTDINSKESCESVAASAGTNTRQNSKGGINSG